MGVVPPFILFFSGLSVVHCRLSVVHCPILIVSTGLLEGTNWHCALQIYAPLPAPSRQVPVKLGIAKGKVRKMEKKKKTRNKRTRM